MFIFQKFSNGNISSCYNIKCVFILLQQFLIQIVFINGDMYFPKGIFPRPTSQVATLKISNFPSGNFPNVHLGLGKGFYRTAGFSWGRALWGQRAAAWTDLGNFRLGNCIFVINDLSIFLDFSPLWEPGTWSVCF